jgi:hypothetical protein
MSERSPNHWDLLSDDDKQIYVRLSAALGAPMKRDKRGRKAHEFREILSAIDVFQHADAENMWKRCLVCGILLFREGVAVNIAQFKRLIWKCRSSINGALAELGYDEVLPRSETTAQLLRLLPALEGRSGEIRQWTIRLPSVRHELAPFPSIATVPFPFAEPLKNE